MKKYTVHTLYLLSLSCSLQSMESDNWPALFEEYAPLIATTPVVREQYEAFIDNNVPSPSDWRLKRIPVAECNEGLSNLFHVDSRVEPRVYMMKNPAYPAEGPKFNSGLPANSLVRNTVASKLLAMVHYLDTLSPHFGYEKGTIDVQVCDALRNEDVQVFLFNLTCQQMSSAYPALTQEEVYEKVALVASPPGAPYIHPSGAAVDIRLWNKKTKKFLDMGDFGVPWTKDHSTFPTFAKHVTKEQKTNRLFSILAAAKAGLVNYPGEYWHYSYGDCMYAYWKNLHNPEKAIVLYDIIPQDHLDISIDENGHFKVAPSTCQDK